MKHRQMAAGFPCEIVRAEVDTGFSKDQLVDLFISSVKQSPANKKIIIILENLEKSSLSELLGDFLGPLENRSTESPCSFQKGNGTSECYYFHENCFLLGTIAKACLQGSDLLVQQHFRWVQLRSGVRCPLPATPCARRSTGPWLSGASSTRAWPAWAHRKHFLGQKLDQHTADFKGGSFPLSIVSSYNSCSKKKESGAWRKVSTSPRKKSGRFSSPTWNKPDLSEEGIKNKTILQLNCNRNASLSKQKSLENDLSLTLNLDQRLSLGSDDEADLVKELQSMCSSKSESDISKIADSGDDLGRFDRSGNNPAFSATVNNPRMPVSQKEVSPLSSHQATECSNSKSKTELGVSRVKSFLPVPRSKVTQCSQNTKRSSSSSNTRQIEINNSKEEI
eukprot:bmy_02465T0